MKKCFALIVSLVLLVSLTACDNETKQTNPSADEATQATTTTTATSGESTTVRTTTTAEPSAPISTSKTTRTTGKMTVKITTADKRTDQSTSNTSVQTSAQSTSSETTTSDATVQSSHTTSTQLSKTTSTQSSKPTSTESSKTASTRLSQTTSSSPSITKMSVRSTTTSTTVRSTQSTTKPSVNTAVTTDTAPAENVNNGVLDKVTSQEMTVPENMKWLGSDHAKEENNAKNIKASVVYYQLDGDVVSWVTDNDYIYVLTSGNNRLVVINSRTMMAICNTPLAGKPAELNLVGDDIYVSLPDLCRIDVFSKANYAKKTSLYFEHEVSSFCIDGDTVYYSKHDQHCDVYKKNMTTNEVTQIMPQGGWTFYQPKLCLNKEDDLLYIGESGMSGSTLYYYDATTLQPKSFFRKNDYGIMNHTRDIFHVGDDLFWGNYRLSDTDAKQILGRYGVAEYGSVNFASKELVSTFEGIFLTDTYECIVDYFDAGFKFEYLLVTQSYNIFFRARSIDKNIIMGVNFRVQ